MLLPDTFELGMTIPEAIKSIKASPEFTNYNNWVDIEALVYDVLGVEAYVAGENTLQQRVREYIVPETRRRHCDTDIGITMLFLDGVPVSISCQHHRAVHPHRFALSVEALDLMINFCVEQLRDADRMITVWPNPGIDASWIRKE